MATEHTRHSRPDSSGCYDNCLITPMGRNGETLIRTEHIIDAALVGLLVFFAVILGDVLTAFLAGNPAYLTVDEIAARTPTGLVAFGLTFVFQWLRARGIDVLQLLNKLLPD